MDKGSLERYVNLCAYSLSCSDNLTVERNGLLAAADNTSHDLGLGEILQQITDSWLEFCAVVCTFAVCE